MDKEDPDYYKILNVAENATADEIKKSYRKLSMIHHPDKNQNNAASTEKFQNISAAYEVLGDPHKRKMHDLSKSDPFQHMMHSSGFNNNSDDEDVNIGKHMNNLFSQLFSNMGGGSEEHPNIRIFRTNSQHPLSENYKYMNTSTQQPQQRPAPLIHTLTVSFSDMFTGALLPIEIERWIMEDGTKKYENEILYVTVPKGVDDNEIIMIPNKGNMSSYTCVGDIRVFIKLDHSPLPEHSEFKRQGLDLIIEKQITLKDALCGFSFIIKHLNGTNYTINNNNRVISPGYHKKIPNLGISRDDHRGSLIILFQIQFPEAITSETVEALKLIDFD